MGATLDALQVLQSIESKLNALRSKIDQKRRLVRFNQKKIADHSSELAKVHDAVRHQQAALDNMELEVKSRDAEITKFREALNKAKTNKEYAAILTQINTGKADNSRLEDQILEHMNRLERLRAQENELKARIAEENQALGNALAVAETFERDSAAELESLTAERDEAASGVPPQALALFERVAERHQGEAIARVAQPHPKREEFICEGCNMSLTLEQFVALQSGDNLQVCHSCGRVLSLDEKAG